MKLDKELVRDILLDVEARTPDPSGWVEVTIAGRTQEEINYHVELLIDPGFLKAREVGDYSGTLWIVERLTYDGHEFLETVRSPEVWRRTKEAAGKVGGVSIAIFAEIAKATAKIVIKDHLGLDLG